MIFIIVFQVTIGTMRVWAGPPFTTDDPETVGYRHWEIDVVTQGLKDKNETSGTAPQVEINYGLLPNADLHMIVLFSYVSSEKGSRNYGLGDIELGVKYQFVQERGWLPMVGISLLAEVPTGNHGRGLGNGRVRVFSPVWLQKSWEPWTTYGGGGYWYNPGTGNKDYWFVGWVVQRELSAKITLGTELFYTTPKAAEEGGEARFNVGGFFNLTEEHHLLFSAGRDIHGPNRLSMYIGYQLTLGPREEKKKGVLSFIRHRTPR